MRQFPNHNPDKDENLVQFLRYYRPIAPSPPQDLETRVMAMIQKHPRSSPVNRNFWMIPSAIAAVLCLAWGGSRWLEPTPNFASQETQSEELAAFLVDNWQNVADPAVNLQADPNLVNQWQALTHSEAITSSSD
ncbi:MAG: hypothetical protein DCF12_07410 [Snowella sp.]|jgi:hypothetical protein|nr:MAG: hypothetical protein DCF12_07410 [Snowella sp.]